MAVQSMGAPSPANVPDAPATGRILKLVPDAGTRTRRNHGVFTLEGHLACVYSTRRAGRYCSVNFELGAQALLVSCLMTPEQARSIGNSLIAAAKAAQAVAQGGAA